MPYLLLKTLISLHCDNPSKNLSYKVSHFEVLKVFLASACGWRSPTAGACAIAVGEDGQYFGQEW
ncbi:hypothetical protein IQ274_21540 [Nostoc sp. LEGE 12447]|nr:hypothetical protein [Nostoc sp. LEGE 12447]